MSTSFKTLSLEQSPLLCFSHLRWNFVYQRPQHLLSRAAQNRQVFFFEEPAFLAGIAPRIDRSVTDEGVTVLTPALPIGLNSGQVTRALRVLVERTADEIGRTDLVLWYYTPMALPFSRQLPASVLVYDNMDELSAFKGAPLRMVAMERELFRRADIVFTGGQSLYESKKNRHFNLHAFPSSIDVPHFAMARRASAAIPDDQASIPSPRIGFFGVIDERMDLALVERVAVLKPDWQFVMIGPVAKIDAAALPRQANLHWLGSKTYAELPAYLRGWDAGFMPFALNEATRFISPTKTPEFLAAAVPVVSTPIADVIRPYGERGLVAIASTAEELVTELERLLSQPKPEWLKKVDQHLAGMSWDQTWANMERLIHKALPKEAQAAIPLKEQALHV
ncbi:hypothetical protein ABID21_001748 [Pseudorhizobium tarimense]|uniref:Glycosyl transferases group 1 n=1 Tax=Pseudorhizobium tarimense TaxID=1079109 RepID=A0ABV2H5E2_9HYPH|nr:glycosyltransferase family 1 protein [Pseudorhizobium tarimense]MCJ8518857.1 glycosyltransferase family 1 protein [Pseudorhizobium tarimense]